MLTLLLEDVSPCLQFQEWNVRPFAIYRSCGEEFNSFIFTAYTKILVMSVWSAIRGPWVPRSRATCTGWLCPVWVATIPPMPLVSLAWTSILKPLLVASPAAATTQQQQIQSKCYLGPPGCICLALYVSCKTAEFASMEDNLCYELSTSLWINVILSVYVQTHILKYCSRQHSLSS